MLSPATQAKNPKLDDGSQPAVWEQVGTLPLTSGVKLAGFYPGLPPISSMAGWGYYIVGSQTEGLGSLGGLESGESLGKGQWSVISEKPSDFSDPSPRPR